MNMNETINSKFVPLYKEIHDDNNFNRRLDQITFFTLPVKDAQNQPFHWLDLINGVVNQSNKIYLDASSNFILVEGWALDGLNDSVASRVFIEVGNEYILANYGKERESVVDYYKKAYYINSGYHACLNAEKVIKAQKFTVHIISLDETYRYESQHFFVSRRRFFNKDRLLKKNAICKPDLHINTVPEFLAIPVKDAQNQPFHWLDYVNGVCRQTDGIFYMDSTANYIPVEGWALDGLNDSVASRVFIEVGGEYIQAN